MIRAHTVLIERPITAQPHALNPQPRPRPQVMDLGGWLSHHSFMRRVLAPSGAVSAGCEALVERMLMSVMLVGGGLGGRGGWGKWGEWG